MSTLPETTRRSEPLSIEAAATAALAFFSVLAGLTLLTHLAQVLRLSFRLYASLCALTAIVILLGVLRTGWRRLRAAQPRDAGSALLLLLVALLGAWLAVSMHRVGRISPDEFYYAANPVFYTQHPDAPMGFESRNFYAPQAVTSASFLTAGAFEYAQGALALLFNVNFATVYYLLGAGGTGFMIPIALFLLISCFSTDVRLSILGTLVTIIGLLMLGETVWAPGANSFLRAFEGKALLQFAGVPLLAALSFRYFAQPSQRGWLSLFAVATGLTGCSTTSFALLPALAAVLCGAYWLANRESVSAQRRWFLHLLLYFAAFIYVVLWALFVARIDGAASAIAINEGYPRDFLGYVTGFIYTPFPLTPVLALVASAAALWLLRGRSRALLACWMVLAVVLVLNPLAAQPLLHYVRGIYYRLFYVFPFPVVMGLAAVGAVARILQLPRNRRLLTATLLGAATAMLAFVNPMSVFRLPLYAWGNPLYEAEMSRASEIVKRSPAGVMLAPYPLAGTITMVDSNREQMLARPDMLDFYLGQQGLEADAALRWGAQPSLIACADDPHLVEALLDDYPEIVSIVIERQAYICGKGAMLSALQSRGFARSEAFISGVELFTR